MYAPVRNPLDFRFAPNSIHPLSQPRADLTGAIGLQPHLTPPADPLAALMIKVPPSAPLSSFALTLREGEELKLAVSTYERFISALACAQLIPPFQTVATRDGAPVPK